MKVIVASYPKTGTKTLNSALSELGYNVYDYVEHFWYHEKEWQKIFLSNGGVEDFKKMYEDVDVVMDAPAYRFWEEIHWAFPDAKIILMLREEERWFASLIKQIDENYGNFKYMLMMTFSPSGRKYFRHIQTITQHSFGNSTISPWIYPSQSEIILKQKYRQHNAYVMQNAPKDQFLLYNIEDGWQPLCELLGKEIPDKPFPHENRGGAVIQKWMKEHPLILKMKREMWISVGFILGLGIIGSYSFYKYGAWKTTNIRPLWVIS